MTERMKFIIRLENGERLSDLCREFCISRKTGYKLLHRYRERGVDGLFDESRKPYRSPHATDENVIAIILDLKNKRPTWGAEKLREYLKRKHSELEFPSTNTFHNILLRNDLVKKRKRLRYQAHGTNLLPVNSPNDLWCADFKGQFRMQNQNYCYPLTISDFHSRYLLGCEGLESTKEGGAFSVFEEIFLKYGLPKAIRTDNGVPFSSNGLLGLSKLSVWWLRLGINIERIEPGHPEQNGRHERMHLTLKQDLLKTPAKNIIQQQEVFENFKEYFNQERPHQSLDNESPSTIYIPSSRIYSKKLPEINYTNCEVRKTVHGCGKVSVRSKKAFYLSEMFVGQEVGLTELENKVWRIYFLDIVLGHYDEKTNKFAAMKELIRENVLPMSL